VSVRPEFLLAVFKVPLSLTAGVFIIGNVSILHVGGVFGRMEYLATGDPLVQAFEAEHQAAKHDVWLEDSSAYHPAQGY